METGQADGRIGAGQEEKNEHKNYPSDNGKPARQQTTLCDNQINILPL